MGSDHDKELTDIALCYQALGTDISATPAQLERLYKSLTDEYKKKLTSLDPAIRDAARMNLEQVGVMYDKITRSITYRAKANDCLNKSANLSDAGSKKAARGANVTVRVACTCCNGLIPKGLRTCPICKSPLYSATEQKMRAHLAPKKLAIYFAILSAVSLAVLGVRSPEKLSAPALGQLLQLSHN